MFFMMGITQGRKDLSYNRMVICDHCGSYGRYEVFMTYMVLSLFFIPCFKWGKKYYVKSTCCDTVWELSADAGKAIARGSEVEITKDMLREVVSGRGRYKRCPACGYETQEDFSFCPKCGGRF